MKSQLLHTPWRNISGEAAGEIWKWSPLGVKGLKCTSVSKFTNSTHTWLWESQVKFAGSSVPTRAPRTRSFPRLLCPRSWDSMFFPRSWRCVAFSRLVVPRSRGNSSSLHWPYSRIQRFRFPLPSGNLGRPVRSSSLRCVGFLDACALLRHSRDRLRGRGNEE